MNMQFVFSNDQYLLRTSQNNATELPEPRCELFVRCHFDHRRIVPSPLPLPCLPHSRRLLVPSIKAVCSVRRPSPSAHPAASAFGLRPRRFVLDYNSSVGAFQGQVTKRYLSTANATV